MSSHLDKIKLIDSASKLAAKGAYDKAIREYQRVLEVDPRDVRVLQKLGELHQKRNENSQAAQCFIKVAEGYAAEGFFPRSAALYKQVLRLDPSLVDINFKLASLHQKLENGSEALGYYKTLLAHYESAGDVRKCIDALAGMATVEPKNPSFHAKLAALYEKAGNTVQAKAEFSVAGELLKANGRYEDYLRVAERQFALGQDDVELAREIAGVYVKLGDHKRALGKLQIAFKADKHDVETLRLLGTTFEGMGQGAKAVSVYKALGQVYDNLGEELEADNIWEKVSQLAPGDAQYAERRDQRISLAQPAVLPAAAVPATSRPSQLTDISKLLSEVDVYFKYGLFDRALDHLGKVFAVEPENITAHQRAYAIYVEMEDRERAVEQLLNVLRLHTRAGTRDSAAPYLEAILREAPDHPEVPAFIAALGDHDEGETDFASAEVVELDADGNENTGDADEAVDNPGDEAFLDGEEAADVDFADDKAMDEAFAEVAVPAVAPKPLVRAPNPVVAARAAVPIPLTPPPPRAITAPSKSIASPRAPAGPLRTAPRMPIALRSAPVSNKPEAAPSARPPAAPARPLAAPPPLRPAVPAPNAARTPAIPARAAPPPLPAPRVAPQPPAARSPTTDASPVRAPQVPPRSTIPRTTVANLTRQRAPAPVEPITESLDIGEEISSDLEQISAADPLLTSPSNFQVSAEEVISEFKKGVQRSVSAKDAETHYALGIAYSEMELIDDAVGEFRIALKGWDGNPKQSDCYAMIGLLLRKRGDLVGATAAFSDGLATTADPPAERAMRYELAETHEMAGALGKALGHYTQVFEQDPNFREVAAHVERLSDLTAPEDDVAARAPRRAS